MYVSLCRGIPESSFRKPPKPEPQNHRLNLGGGAGNRGRKISCRPQFAGPMELETLMEEGAGPGPGGREGDAQPADGGTSLQLTNGDKTHRDRDDEQTRPQRSTATMKQQPSPGASRSGSSTLNLFLAASTVNMAALAAGCALTWSSPTLTKLENGEWIGNTKITSDESSWVGSLVTLGAAIGPLLAGALLDRLGRKNTILLSMALSIISWIVIGFVPNLNALYGARVLAGIAVGIIFTAVPMYIAEISEAHLRSSLGTLMQFFLVAGFLVEYIVGPYTSYLTLVIVSMAMPILCFGMFMWMPDSPQSSLIRPGKEQNAMEALRWLRGNPNESTLMKELDEIKRSVDEAKEQKSGVVDLISNRGNVKALYISCAMVAWQQLSGINVVLMFSESIFKETGVAISPSLSTIIVGSVMLVAAGATPPLAKLVSMKNMLYISAIGMTITDALLGLFFYILENDKDSVSGIKYLPVASLVIFIITYCLGFGPLPWAIMGEIFPSNLKSVASGLTASFCWFLGFMLTKSFGTVSKYFGKYVPFWFYAFCCVFALLFSIFILPDTQGKSLQEIQDMLQGKRRTAPENHKMTKT